MNIAGGPGSAEEGFYFTLFNIILFSNKVTCRLCRLGLCRQIPFCGAGDSLQGLCLCPQQRSRPPVPTHSGVNQSDSRSIQHRRPRKVTLEEALPVHPRGPRKMPPSFN